LLRYVEEFRKRVLITGFRNVRIETVQKFLQSAGAEKTPNVEVQVFDAGNIATWQHLYFAVLNALTAFKNKANVSRSLAMEIMLYASAQRQIRKATEILGVRPTSTKIAMVMVGDEAEDLESLLSRISKQINAESDEKVIELTDEKMVSVRRTFSITDEELRTVMKGHETKKALVDLVIERMALLATER
jgi:KEOPS complex subunit Cgi121